MGTFVTQDTEPTLFPDGDKVAAPGVTYRPGWDGTNVLSASEMNAIRDALLDCRTGIRANGSFSVTQGTRKARTIFQVTHNSYHAPDLDTSPWTFTNGGTPTTQAVDHATGYYAYYLKQNATNSFHATVNSGATAIIYNAHRPRLAFAAKFGVNDAQRIGMGWASGDWFDVQSTGNGDAARFIYNLGSHGATWLAATSNGSAVTTTALTGTDPLDATWHTFEIDYSSASQVVFRIDRTVVATHTTNLPRSAAAAGKVAVTSQFITGGTGGDGAELWCHAIELETATP